MDGGMYKVILPLFFISGNTFCQPTINCPKVKLAPEEPAGVESKMVPVGIMEPVYLAVIFEQIEGADPLPAVVIL